MKVAFITGAGRGIGKAVALGLAQDGYNIALLSRSQNELSETKKEIENLGGKALTFAVDVSKYSLVDDAVAKTVKEWGRIDVLFNNAGIYQRGTLEVTPEEFEKVISVNLNGAFYCMKLIAPIMLKQKAGYIINLGSICSKIGYAEVGAYTASKFGLLGLNESLFNELVPQGIGVSAILPSWVHTQMSSHAPISGDQMIQPNDILTTVRYLLALGNNASVKEILIQSSRAL